ncbi:DUF1496 domain-containing protein [Cupriavidus basilensis]
MKRIVVLLALAAGFAANAGAQTAAQLSAPAPAGERAARQEAAPAPKLDPATYCYYDGKPYSEGAVVAGKTCSDRVSTGVAVFTPNTPAA